GDEQIIHINLEDLKYEGLLEYHALHDYVVTHLCQARQTYVFIDEVQQCKGFEKAVDSIYIKSGVDLYITGSNATMLSGELATLLSGRYIQIKMLPFSFREFCRAREALGPTRKTASDTVLESRMLFDDYLRFGSFPAIAVLGGDSQEVHAYLEGIYNTTLIKDVSVHNGIRDVGVLQSIVRFLCSNLGGQTSINQIAKAINKSGRNVSVNTVEGYVDALAQSYLFYRANRFDIRGKQHLKTLGKFFIVDTGLREFLIGGETQDMAQLIENIVYLELLRRNTTVSVGKFDQKEIDFIASGEQGVAYYQVAVSVLDSQVLERELVALSKVKDNHPKYLLTLDELGRKTNHNGILQYNVIDWLLNA
ncbi:MAG: ATP-binding protein, partial [Coriobacteriales bacterium]|nr:ATP-binding protein [Coriobacteriales bacterium]